MERGFLSEDNNETPQIADICMKSTCGRASWKINLPLSFPRKLGKRNVLSIINFFLKRINDFILTFFTSITLSLLLNGIFFRGII